MLACQASAFYLGEVSLVSSAVKGSKQNCKFTLFILDSKDQITTYCLLFKILMLLINY